MKYYYTIFDMLVPNIPVFEDVDKWVRRFLFHLNITVQDQTHHFFGSQYAYTGIYILSESNFTIHTCPEANWIEVVFALCKDINLEKLESEVMVFFRPEKILIRKFIGEPPREKRSLV